MNNIRIIRKKNGITMRQLGAAIGVTESAISLYETGKCNPGLDILQKMSVYLKTPIAVLLGEKELEEQKKPDTSVSQGIELSDDEQKLIALYRSLSDRNRLRAYSYLEGAAGSQETPSSDQH